MSAKKNDGLTCQQRYRLSAKGKMAEKKYQDKYTRKPDTRYIKFLSSCKSRGIECTLSKEEFIGMIGKKCTYCYEDVTVECGSGLDRIDSSRGYTSDNVVPCCRRCNVAKNDMNLEQFKDFIRKCYIWTVLDHRTQLKEVLGNETNV